MRNITTSLLFALIITFGGTCITMQQKTQAEEEEYAYYDHDGDPVDKKPVRWDSYGYGKIMEQRNKKREETLKQLMSDKPLENLKGLEKLSRDTD